MSKEEKNNPKDPDILTLYKEINELKISLAVIKTDVSWIKRWFAPIVLISILSLILNILLTLLKRGG